VTSRGPIVPSLAFGVALLTLARAAAAGDTNPGDSADVLEHTVIVGVGGAVELELADRSLHAGGNVMVEWEAIEDWLELELGVSALAADGGVEAPIELLFKKPFRLARWAELMPGVGPQVVVVSSSTTRAAYLGGELALDFMFWPWGRRVGLWVEPAYEIVFRDGVSHGLGGTGGVLVGW
jgi:hypothetical protein